MCHAHPWILLPHITHHFISIAMHKCCARYWTLISRIWMFQPPPHMALSHLSPITFRVIEHILSIRKTSGTIVFDDAFLIASNFLVFDQASGSTNTELFPYFEFSLSHVDSQWLAGGRLRAEYLGRISILFTAITKFVTGLVTHLYFLWFSLPDWRERLKQHHKIVTLRLKCRSAREQWSTIERRCSTIAIRLFHDVSSSAVRLKECNGSVIVIR